MDSATGDKTFTKANKITIYQKVVDKIHNKIRGERFTTITNQPLQSEALQSI